MCGRGLTRQDVNLQQSARCPVLPEPACQSSIVGMIEMLLETAPQVACFSDVKRLGGIVEDLQTLVCWNCFC